MKTSPLDWFETTLGESFQTVTGNTPPKSKVDLYGEAIPLVKPPELNDGEVGNATDGLSEKGSRVARIAPVGSTLVSCIGNLGKIGLTTAEVAFNQQINAIFPAPSIAIPEFVYFLALSPQFRDQLLALSSGTTVPIVNKTRFNSIKFLLPPLEEQKRIVAVLDQALAALDRACAYAEDNLQDSNLLFKEILHRTICGAFRRDQTNFSKCSLADALEVIRNGVNCDQKAGGRCKISRIESIATGSFNLDRVGYAELTESQKERARLLPGDILFSHINSVPHVGKTAVFDVDDGVYHGINLLLLRPSKGILSGYMSWFLKAVHATKYWESVCKKSVNQASVNQKDIGKVPFFFPSTAKQSQVVQTLDDVSIQVANARQSYIEKLSELADLRQSLLQKAFSGQL